MQDLLRVCGMVVGVFPQGEYDRRITILSRERGKITAFVKGAKKAGNRFMATTDLFAFGYFDLYVGKTSNTVQNVEISNYFEYLRDDLEASLYAQYFAELADYYSKEGADESVNLLLLYRALQALKIPSLDNKYVRAVYEIKLFEAEGELIPYEQAGKFSVKGIETIEYICQSSIEKMFNHPCDEIILSDLQKLSAFERGHLVDRRLKSLELLNIF